MTTPRITQRLLTENSLASMRNNLGRLARTQEQLSTGKSLNRPSDSPGSTHTAMRMREQLATNEQAVRNAEDGLGWLQRTDGTLSSMSDQLRRARDLTVQAANTGASSPEAREAIALELTQIRQSLLAQANTQHLGRPLFGGNATSPQAYDASGTYLGDQGSVRRSLADGQQVAVNTTGPDAFGEGADSLFAVLDQTISSVRAGGADLGQDLTRIDASMTRLHQAQASAGSRQNRVEAALTDLSAATLDVRALLSEVEDVDMARAVVDLQMQEVAYQAALGTTARVLQPSLIDFLR